MQHQMSRHDQVLEKRLSSDMAEPDMKVNLTDLEAEHQVKERTVLELRNELMNKEKTIESLKIELVKAKELQLKLAEKDVAMDEMRKELMKTKSRTIELEAELKNKTESEVKLLESLYSQTKHLEQTKISLEESKLEIDFLSTTGDSKTKSAAPPRKDQNRGFDGFISEAEFLKKELARVKKSEMMASSRAESLGHEMSLLKNELKLAMEAEEKSRHAMDELASVLKEVSLELHNVKEELSEETELEQMRSGVNNNEQKLKTLYDEARKEANQYKNKSERLRHEAEETLLACNEKEAGFINYIKKVEEERSSAQKENKRLIESLLESEKMTRTSKDETHKLRDILKQALNEANAAKEASGIAKHENSELKDCLVEKDRALDFLTHEYENLKQRDIAAEESVIALKRLLQRGSLPKEPRRPDDEDYSDSAKETTSELEEDRVVFDVTELRMPKPKRMESDEVGDMDEALRGSIFDTQSPGAEQSHHRKKSSSVYTDDSETMVTDEESDHVDENGNRMKKRALLRRFGDLLIRKRVGHHHHQHRREPSY